MNYRMSDSAPLFALIILAFGFTLFVCIFLWLIGVLL